MPTFFGPGISFTRGPNGYFHQLEDTDLIKDNILQILLTNPGERVRLPEFGSRLRELVFEPNDAILEGLAKIYIKEAIERWEDRIEFTGLDFVSDDHELKFGVHFTYRFNKLPGKVVVPLKRLT